MKTKSEKGFTLVEILAALIILGIVIISYMTIFPQMVNINDRTETKLETMNVAKQLLNEVRESNGELPLLYKYKSADISKKEVYYEGKKDGYKIELICLAKDSKSEMCSKTVTEKEERKIELYKIHIKVRQQDKLVSETFGYVKLR